MKRTPLLRIAPVAAGFALVLGGPSAFAQDVEEREDVRGEYRVEMDDDETPEITREYEREVEVQADRDFHRDDELERQAERDAPVTEPGAPYRQQPALDEEIGTREAPRSPLLSADERFYERDRDTEHLQTQMGVGVLLGGGALGFARGAMRDITDPGGAWTARVVLGTRQFLGLEAAYVGSAQNITTAGLDPDAVLLGNGAEGLLRLNFTQTALQPYAFGGAAWKNYRVVNDSFNESIVRNSNNILETPVGLGVAYRFRGFLADLRGNYRFAFSDNLLQDVGTGQSTSMDNWNAEARIGWEF